ncbi:MAG TPA: hemerythrin domain-containing protein, partial [Rhabdaerophilum sp.]|nr:hemerythrin domain-containing protein [Rhabdaerophilum sp.]
MNPASMNPAGMNPAGMGQADRDQAGQEAFSIPALPAELLDRPLDYLAADHERHRAVCAFLKRVVRDGAIRGAVAGFLNKEFPLHLADEHGALYPALVRRSRDDEDFVAALQRIAAAQDAAVASLTPVVSGLKAVSALPAARLTPQLAQ